MASVKLEDILFLCAKGSLAAQRYVALELLHLQSITSAAEGATVLELSVEHRKKLVEELQSAVNVNIKKELDYKEGSASHDLVTTADILTQAVLEYLLNRQFGPALPFTIVGEEDSSSPELQSKVDHCIRHFYSDDVSVPHSDEFATFLVRLRGGNGGHTLGVISADSVEALRKRVGVFIDPIDGTNCFVDGNWEVPMTLVGLTLDGVPVAAVVNRVFDYPVGEAATGYHTKSLSYVWNVPVHGAAQKGEVFLVHKGAIAQKLSRDPVKAGETLLVTHSSTTKKDFLSEALDKLSPTTSVSGRGAGNKEFFLVQRSLAEMPSSTTVADAFICPASTIKKWDTCAPHAFLLALGGNIFTEKGTPLLYPLSGSHEEISDLPMSLVATTEAAFETVASRFSWGH